MNLASRIGELKDSENFWVMAYLAILTYISSVVLFTVLFIAAPLLIQIENSLLLGVGAMAYNIVSLFVMCHQLPERSLFLLGMQFPICSRCLGIYIGSSFGGLIALSQIGKKLPRFLMSKKMLLVFALPMIVDGVTQTLLFERESSNMLRLVTGLMFGFGVLYFSTSIIVERARTIKSDTEIVWKLAVGINLFILFLILAAGLYVGTKYVSKEEALDMALSVVGVKNMEYRVYYIPANAVRNIRNDPYLSSYNDLLLKDLMRVDYRKHGYGVWAVALLNEKPKSEGKVVYFSEGNGAYVYIDAMNKEIIFVENNNNTKPIQTVNSL